MRPAIVNHAGHFAEGTEQDIETLGKRLGKTVQKIFDNSQEIPVLWFCSGLHRLVFPYRHLPTEQDLRSEIKRYQQEIAHILEIRRLMPENPSYRNFYTDQVALRQEMIAQIYVHPAAFHEDIEEILVREVGLLLNELKHV